MKYLADFIKKTKRFHFIVKCMIFVFLLSLSKFSYADYITYILPRINFVMDRPVCLVMVMS